MYGYSPQLGDLCDPNGRLILRAGFMHPGIGPGTHLPNGGIERGISTPIYTRGANFQTPDAMKQIAERIERGATDQDLAALLLGLQAQMTDFGRAVVSTQTGFPVRENLEAEAKLLIPLDTPVRNKLARPMGSGLASLWRQITSLGGGYGISTTTVNSGTSSATQTLVSTTGMAAGDILYFTVTGASRVIQSVTNGTVVVLTATISTTTAEQVNRLVDQPGATTAIRTFFAESGAPAEHTTVYAAKTASYKLLGGYGSVSGLAMAGGANFQNQMATEKTNAIRNLMLNEENALINGSSTDTAVPWGDGSNALGFDGLINLITTGNGTPSAQVQTAVGALTTTHIDAQLTRLWKQGAQGLWMLMNGQEILSLTALALAAGSPYRVIFSDPAKAYVGASVQGYIHPITGELVPILPSRFLQAGVILFGSDRLPDGSPTMDVEVLPQVQLPELAPNDNVQGYTAQELAPALTAPQVYPFICSVYEVLRLKSANHVAKSSGVTAVS